MKPMTAISLGIAKGDEHEEFSIESEWGLHGKAYGKEEAHLFAAAPDLLESLENLLIEFRQLSLANLKNDETSENHRCKVFDLHDVMYWNALTIIKKAKGL